MNENGPVTNNQGQFSGAKIILWLSSGLALAWSIRDLVTNRDLDEWNAGLIAMLLIISLVNRISARSNFRVRLRDMEIETSCPTPDRNDHFRPGGQFGPNWDD